VLHAAPRKTAPVNRLASSAAWQKNMEHSRENRNPWLNIPAGDYEGHMSHESVRQLQALNTIFEGIVDKYRPRRLVVLGCATGNGFEHIRRDVTEVIVGVDVNEEYLDILEHRYMKSLPELELICRDVMDVRFEPRSFDHVHAGLILEYVDPPRILGRIASWLDSPGVCSIVLQLPSHHSAPITQTPYRSLEQLEPLMTLVEPDDLVATARSVGLIETGAYDVDLEQGKKLRVVYLEKSDD
jgi:SAM-dependent methyltransferase